MIRRFSAACVALTLTAMVFAQDAPKVAPKETPKAAPKDIDIGKQAPAFKFKDQAGNELDLAELTAKGPVLVRLTCGCLGCDKELPYFQEIDAAYKKAGLISIAVFREPDAKIAKYADEKKIAMVYTVDPKGESWKVFQTKAMPINFLIAKGGEIVAIASGCDTSGLLAKKLSEKIAKTTGTDAVDVQNRVDEKKK